MYFFSGSSKEMLLQNPISRGLNDSARGKVKLLGKVRKCKKPTTITIEECYERREAEEYQKSMSKGRSW